eukprot:3244559-Amphidinium_carterae.1
MSCELHCQCGFGRGLYKNPKHEFGEACDTTISETLKSRQWANSLSGPCQPCNMTSPTSVLQSHHGGSVCCGRWKRWAKVWQEHAIFIEDSEQAAYTVALRHYLLSPQ